MSARKMAPVHPGEIPLGEFLKPLGISRVQAGQGYQCTAARINEIVQGKRSITADTAPRLARYFGLSERFWLTFNHDMILRLRKTNWICDLRERLES